MALLQTISSFQERKEQVYSESQNTIETIEHYRIDRKVRFNDIPEEISIFIPVQADTSYIKWTVYFG